MTQFTNDPDTRTASTSLDLLEAEDRRILELSDELVAASRESVEDRAQWGNRAKLLVRHVATREASLLDVVVGTQHVAGLEQLSSRFMGDPEPRRQHLNTVEHMSRGVKGISLNTGQEFDAELEGLVEVLRPGITFDLIEGVPAVRAALDEQQLAEVFQPADHVARHAPTHVDPHRPRWWERTPVVSRLVTAFHHSRDYPGDTRDRRT
jgi:hypothetical protein